LNRWIDARKSLPYLCIQNVERLGEEINIHIKVVAKPFERDYETPRTAGKSDRLKLVSEESRERRKCRK
jgi:hypothetical protein